MPLLRNGELRQADAWHQHPESESLPADTSALVLGLDHWLMVIEDGQAGGISGVRLAPSDDPMRLSGHLDRLQLICLEFPAFTDGRGYSHARTLRQTLGYTGEIRAIGDVRPDQLLFMMRVGIDAFALAKAPDPERLTQLLHRYRLAYQPSYALPIAG